MARRIVASTTRKPDRVRHRTGAPEHSDRSTGTGTRTMNAHRAVTFAERLATAAGKLSAAELAVANFIGTNREEVLLASALELGEKIGTSDATVIRTAKALGFAGLDPLRRQLAAELRASLSPAARLTRTLGDVSHASASPLALTVRSHIASLER